MSTSIFNPSNVNRIEVMSETIKTYENTMTVLYDLLKQKEIEEKEAFNHFVKNESTLEFYLHLLKKDTLGFETTQLKAIIECQNRDLEQERRYLRDALEHSEKNKKRKLEEKNFILPQSSSADLYME